MWGYHLLLDCGECNEQINNPDKVKDFLSTLVKEINMYPIGAPMVVYVDTKEGKGVSGVQLITTSTITFHGDDAGKAVYLDVFSCKEYDTKKVIALFQAYFEPKTIIDKFITRDAILT